MSTAKEFLNSVLDHIKREDALLCALESCKARLDITGMAIDDMPGNPNASDSAIPNALIGLHQTIETMEQELAWGNLLYAKCEEMFAMMTVDGVSLDLIDTLRLRFICGKSWGEISRIAYRNEKSLRNHTMEQLATLDCYVPADVA